MPAGDRPGSVRHPLVPPLFVVLALVGYALLGAVLVGAAPAVDGNVTVSGTATGPDGAPVEGAYVLLEPMPADRLDEATAGDRVVAESLLRFGMADVDGVWTARTDADGRYAVAVPPGEYAVVAVVEDDRAVSHRHDVAAEGGTTVNLTVDPGRVQSLAGEEVSAEPGEAVQVPVRLTNTDDETVRTLAVTFETLPDGWTLRGVETGGNYDPESRTVTWETVGPGETVTAAVTVAVPADADPGRRGLLASADSESHHVEWTDRARVSVDPPGRTPTEVDTPSPVTDAPGGDTTGRDGGADTEWPPGGSGEDDGISAPGFGVPAAVFALVAAALAARRP